MRCEMQRILILNNKAELLLIKIVSRILLYDLSSCRKFGHDRNVESSAERIDAGKQFALGSGNIFGFQSV